MARARNIKPAFFINVELGELEPVARLLFIGLWTVADREGRLKDQPPKIKIQTLPYDDCDIDMLLNQLQDKGFILRYQAGNCKLIQIINFTKHQNPHVKEQGSELPAPDMHHASTMQAPGKNGSSTADSLLLIPDSLNIDSLTEQSEEVEPNAKQADKLFEHLWNIYPRKKGKGQVKPAKKRELFKIGQEHLERCVRRFKEDMEQEQRAPDKYPYGSTFFNSGYIDYLDDNYERSNTNGAYRNTESKHESPGKYEHLYN